MCVKTVVGLSSLVVLAFIILVCSVPTLLTSYQPNDINFKDKLQPPSATHPLGTDDMGRDQLARILYGGRVTLWSSLIIATGSVLFATLWGTVSAYVGGAVDEMMTRIADLLMNIPSLLFVLLLVSILSPGMISLITALILIKWAGYARIIRGQVYTLLSAEFIEAARSIGAIGGRIICKHIIPNTWFMVITIFGLVFTSSILSISSLNFLGFGVKLPYAEWGAMINYARPFLQTHPHLMLFPGLAIAVTIVATNLAVKFTGYDNPGERSNHL
jgi:ABC-type dipeptide/oligopeptide/nickel transport system permease subunit